MTWINNQIAKILPGYALKREIARRRLQRLDQIGNSRGKNGNSVIRSFEAVSGNRLRYDFLAPKNSADSALSNADALRNHIRQLEYNNGFVAGPIKRIVDNVIGLGFRFQSRVIADKDSDGSFPKITLEDAKKFNRNMEIMIRRWAKKADKRMIMDFNGILSIIEGALIRDNGVLVVGRESARRDRLIPYCLEVLEIDRLQTPMEEIANPKIRNGIRYDEEGVPKSYLILKSHPGETIMGGITGSDFDEIPAFNDNGTRKVFHLFNPIRPEQSIGFSAFASALKDYQDLDRYREAEIMAALEAACLTGIVETPDPVSFQGGRTVENLDVDDDETIQRIHEFSPGMWQYLAPGEKADIFNPSRPNEAFGEFTDQLLRGPANALNIPPEVLSQNWHGMNYSNARTVLLQLYLTCRLRQKYLITDFCMPNYEVVARSLIARGLVKAIGFDRRMDDYLEHVWIPPGWNWVDPVKEAQGKQIELDNIMETLTDILASKGKDIDEHLEQKARELKKMQDLEEEYGVSFQNPKKGNASQQSGDEEDVAQAALELIQGGK